MTGFRQGTVTDEYTRPVLGAQIYVYDSAGQTAKLFSDPGATIPLTQPVTADEFGFYTYYAPDAIYREDTWYGGKLRYKEIVLVGSVDILKGLPGSPSAGAYASRAAIQALNSVGLDNVLLTEPGREGFFVFDASNLTAKVALDPGQGIYVPPASDTTGAHGAWVRKFSGPADLSWFGPGTADDTARIQGALSLCPRVLARSGSYIVTALTVQPGCQLITEGFATLFKQKAGTAANTRIITLTNGAQIVGDISGEGRLGQPDDTGGEQNHFIFIQGNSTVGSLTNIVIGNVKGTNIRGDAVYVGAQSGFTTTFCRAGDIIANNVYRNALTVAGGVTAFDYGDVDGRTAGLFAVDLEPNTGEGDVSGIRGGHILGRRMQSAASGQTIKAQFKSINIDPGNGAGSAPAYPFAFNVGYILRDAVIGCLGTCKINGFPSSAMDWASGGSTTPVFTCAVAEITNCCQTSTATGFFAGGIEYHFGRLSATTTNAAHLVFLSSTNAKIDTAVIALLTGSKYMASCTDCKTDELIVTKPAGDGGNGGIVFSSCTRCKVKGGGVTGDRLFSFGSGGRADGMVLTLVTGALTGSTGNSRLIGCTVNGVAWELLSYGGTVVIASIDGTGALAATGSATITSGYVNVATEYRLGNQKIVGARKSGWALPTGTASRATFDTATVTLSQLAEHVNALINDLHSAGVGSTHALLTT
jgi:hypothetical protein